MFTQGHRISQKEKKIKHSKFRVLLITFVPLFLVLGLFSLLGPPAVGMYFRGCSNSAFSEVTKSSLQDSVQKLEACFSTLDPALEFLYGDTIDINKKVELSDAAFPFAGYEVRSAYTEDFCIQHHSSDRFDERVRCLVQTVDLRTIDVPDVCVSAYEEMKPYFAFADSFYWGGDLYSEQSPVGENNLYLPGSRHSFSWPGNPEQVSSDDTVYRYSLEWRFYVYTQIYSNSSGTPECLVYVSEKYPYRFDDAELQNRYIFDPYGTITYFSGTYEDGDKVPKVDNGRNSGNFIHLWPSVVFLDPERITNAIFIDLTD